MAWTHVQGLNSETGSGTTASLSFGAAVGSGHVVCGYLFYTTSLTNVITSITDDKSNSYTVVRFISGAQSLACFWGGPFFNGPTTITANVSVSQTNLWIGQDEFTPPAGTIALDGSNAAAGTAITSSGSYTTTANGDLVYSSVAASTATVDTGNGFTSASGGSPSNFAAEFLTQSSAGSIAGTWVSTTGNTAIIAFSLSAIAGGITLGAGKLT